MHQQKVMEAWREWFRAYGVSEEIIAMLIDKGPNACYWVWEVSHA
jgi:hypothetical protein